MTERTTCEQRVRSLLAEITLKRDCLHSPSETALEVIGVDSLGMIELVYGLEDRFSITIGDDEVLPENFASIAALTALVERKCG